MFTGNVVCENPDRGRIGLLTRPAASIGSPLLGSLRLPSIPSDLPRFAPSSPNRSPLDPYPRPPNRVEIKDCVSRSSSDRRAVDR